MFPQQRYEKREPFAVRSERFLRIEIDNAKRSQEPMILYQKGIRHALCGAVMGRFLVCLVLNLQSVWPMQKQEMMSC